MPKYTEPKDACGLSLRAVIEGELMTSFPALFYEQVKLVADRLEARIHAGPSDWLSLSDGTTFSKTWVPTPAPVERWKQFGGHIETDPDPVQRAADTIHEAHEERVKANTERQIRRVIKANFLEEDIVDHERWLKSFGHARIFVRSEGVKPCA